MTEQKYLEERLQDQLNWHDKKSAEAQKRYKKLKFIIIVIAAVIPIISMIIIKDMYAKITVSSLSAIITMLESYLTLNQLNENRKYLRNHCARI